MADRPAPLAPPREPDFPSQRPPRWRLPVLVALLAAAGAVLTAIVFISVGEEGRQIEITGAGETQRLFGGIRQEGSELGHPEAPVTVSMFNDLQCVPCATYHAETVPALIEDLVRPDRARLEFRNFSVGPRPTTRAGLAAAAAGVQDREWQYVNLFFANQNDAEEFGVSDDLLRGVAGAVLGLNVTEWEGDVDSSEVKAEVERDAELARELRLRAMAAAVVDGPGGTRVLMDAPSVAEIEAALAEVE